MKSHLCSFTAHKNRYLLHFLPQDPGLLVVGAEKNRKFSFGAGKSVERERLALDKTGQGSILVRQFLKKKKKVS